MRIFITIIMLFLLSFSPAIAAGNDCSDNFSINKRICCIGDYDLDIDGGDVYLYPDRHHYDEIRITEDYRLFVNGHEIDLDDDEKELVGEIHELALDIEKQAYAIGREGAKLGAAGAKIGIQAVAGVFKLLRFDYDSEDLEEEIEYKAQKLEAQAEELEERAEDLEDMADELETLADRLERDIPEIRDN
ncbi:MAG: hypothetical protein V3W18_12055 [candidate division Zixibacteria bacterium]